MAGISELKPILKEAKLDAEQLAMLAYPYIFNHELSFDEASEIIGIKPKEIFDIYVKYKMAVFGGRKREDLSLDDAVKAFIGNAEELKYKSNV